MRIGVRIGLPETGSYGVAILFSFFFGSGENFGGGYNSKCYKPMILANGISAQSFLYFIRILFFCVSCAAPPLDVFLGGIEREIVRIGVAMISYFSPSCFFFVVKQFE